ncbi:MAG: hypothetical protein V7754_22275 [Halioglobus sp.]
MTRIFMLALLLCAASSYGQQWHGGDGKQLADTESQKSGQHFGAQLILTNSDEELSARWNVPSEGVDIDASDTVRRNESISAFIIFGGCKANSSGNCRLAVEYSVTQPDGKIYSQPPPMEVWYDKEKPPGHSLELSVDYLKVVFEQGELVGKYEVVAKVTDLNADESIVLKSEFTASD